MSLTVAFLGLEYGMVLVTTGAVAAIATAAAMFAILFFTFAPHVSPQWAAQLGVGHPDASVEEPSADGDATPSNKA